MFSSSVVIVCIVRWHVSAASYGDRSVEFQKCLDSCLSLNCSSDDLLNKFYNEQSLALRLTRWSCADECGYHCMWSTVDVLYSSFKILPQFYGKWPFVRILGLQEPASVLFSLLNLLSCCYMAAVFRRNLPAKSTVKRLWQFYASLGIVTWTFSAIFHARDYPWTERLDYFCAFASILFGLYACLTRLIGCNETWKFIVIGLPLFAYFVGHVLYLSLYRFDYNYNMKAGISFGILNSAAWLLWSVYRYGRYRAAYVLNCCFVIVVANCLLLLEVFDFPPLFWLFDAHSLWHLGTSPLPLIWTKFVVEDARTLLREEEDKKAV